MPSPPSKPKPAKAKVKLPTSKAPKNKKAKAVSSRKHTIDKPATKAPKVVTVAPGDDLLDLIPFKPKPVSLYMHHKEVVHGIIDKVKGNSTLKRTALKAFRTAIHAKRDRREFLAKRFDVWVARTIVDNTIIYDIYKLAPLKLQHLQQLSHQRNKPAIFL